ncbi:MAG: aminoacyl-tRNA hydrolase [Deltaproteobacteria bacterium]|nr:aminoacyl-tRNA hydrolase [Deltaproteobacteria bacterium]
MKLIAGLGNPGIRYRMSRHNAGSLVLDQLALQQNISLDQNLFNAHIGKGKIAGSRVLLVQPQTFMNLSGIAIRELADYFRIDIGDLIVVHDDLDLSFRTIRLKAGGGHGGHKGLISIMDHLGGREFLRVRLGIGRPARKTMVEGYVLEPFSKEEMACLPQLTIKAAEAVTDILTSGIQAAMEKHHGEEKPILIKED